MNQSASIDPIRLDYLTDRIHSMVWTQGCRAVTLIAGGIDFNQPECCDPSNIGFVGTFDERAGTGAVREAVRYTMRQMQGAV